MTYTQPQKAVAALLSMGKPEAEAVLARLSKDETDRLLANSRNMRSVPVEDLAAIAFDFEKAFNAAIIYDADTSFHRLVTEARGNGLDADKTPEVEAASEVPAAFGFTAFENADTHEIVEFLADEDAFVAACVLTGLAGDMAGEVLQLLDDTRRADIFRAMAALGEANPFAFQAIDGAANDFFNDRKADSNAGKLTGLARLLNSIDREAAESAIQSLKDTFEEKDLSALRSMLFRFEDIVKLEAGARSAVFDSLSADTITLALRDADEVLRESILSSISQRTRRIIENDLKAQTNINQKAVRTAQKLVVSQILQLAAVGSLALPGNELEAA